MLNVFFKEEKDYTSQLSPVKNYIDQLAYFVSKQKNIPLEEARTRSIAYVKKNFKDPAIRYFERQENGDREVKDSTLLAYLTEHIKNKDVIAPTLTTYMNASVKESIIAKFASANVKNRAKAKKEGQQAKAEGNHELAVAKNNEQNNKKIYNNALSGLFGQAACVLYNQTAHNTLTSLTRTITSISNASNERLLSGNRYYPRPIDLLNSIVYISTYTNIEEVREAVEAFNLKLPTVQEVVESLRRSTDFYFHADRFYNEKIIPFLEKLDKYTLANIVYSGDLYHIRVHNSDFMRQVVADMTRVNETPKVLDDIGIIKTIPEPVLYFAHAVLFSKLSGYGKDYDKMNKDGVASMVYETSRNIMEAVTKYSKLFRAFFMSAALPNNSFRLNNMIRRVVLLSDTDSTCFTVDEWVTWYKDGEFIVDNESIALGGCLAYIASQAIVNTLANISSSINVSRENLFGLAMKNEFLWTAHAPCEVSKHYYAYTVMQEGNVFMQPEIEIKGVHLKNSAVSVDIIKDSKKLIEHILSSVHNNKKISLTEIVKHIVDIENRIISSVRAGEPIFLKRSKIKDKTAYSQDEFKSPYQRHVLWEEVFAPVYGNLPVPPYGVVKVPTTITSPVALKEWLSSIEDLELRDRLSSWLARYSKKDLPTIYLNEDKVKGGGIPKEILPIINTRQIVFDSTMQHRIILETLGALVNPDLLVQEQFGNLL